MPGPQKASQPQERAMAGRDRPEYTWRPIDGGPFAAAST